VPTLASLVRENIPQMDYFGMFLAKVRECIIWTLRWIGVEKRAGHSSLGPPDAVRCTRDQVQTNLVVSKSTFKQARY
jgi:hypothetical protein